MRKYLVVGVLVSAFLLLPLGQAYAGDREWATAGKVLAGVVGAKILFDGWDNRYYERPVVTYRTYRTTEPYYRSYDYGRRYDYDVRYRTYYRPRRTHVHRHGCCSPNVYYRREVRYYEPVYDYCGP